MSLSNKQFSFAKDVVLLLNFAMANDWKFTLGEFQRTKEQQRIYMNDGRSQTMKSLHLQKMAGDIFFFKPVYNSSDKLIDHRFTMNKNDLQDIGDFWESLNKKNEWGGNWESFQDTPHFQQNKT